MAGNVAIKITGDPSSAKRAFKEVGDASGTMGSHFGSLMGTVGKLATALGGLYALKKVADFLGDSAKAAMEDAKAKEILHTAIVNMTGATEGELAALDAYIEKTQAATGFTEEELRPAMVKLTEATKDVGRAQELLAIAMDVSTARGVSLETVTLALEKAQNGQLTSLQRLGVTTKDAAGEALSFDQILKNLADTYGGATAAAADTFQGKMERMKLVFGELKESIGTAMLPALESIATTIVNNMPTFEKLATTFSETIGGALSFVAETVVPALQEVWSGAWPVLQEVMADFTAWFKSPDGQKVLKDGIEAIKEVMAALQVLWESAWPIIHKALEAAVPGLVNLLGGVADALGLIADMLDIVTLKFDNMSWDTWKDKLRELGNLVGTVMTMGVERNMFGTGGASGPTNTHVSPGGATNTHVTPGGYGTATGYALGGVVSRPALVSVAESGAERVLSAHQTQLFERMVRALEAGRGGGITIYATGNSGAELGNSIASSLSAVGAI